MTLPRRAIQIAAQSVGIPAGIVTFACVIILVGSYVQATRRAPEDKARVEQLKEAVKEDAAKIEALREELDRQTEVSLSRQAMIDTLSWVVIVSSVVMLLCAKTHGALAGRRAPELERVLDHRIPERQAKRNRPCEVPSAAPVANGCEQCPGNGRSLDYVDEITERLGTQTSAVIPILQAIQSTEHYLPEPALRRVCERTDITPAQIVGVSSFYTHFRRTPAGEHKVKVCQGTACHVAGANTITDAVRQHLHIPDGSDTDAQRRFTVQEVACLGCCTLAPVIQIEETTYGHVAADGVADVLEEFLDTAVNGTKRLAAAAPRRRVAGDGPRGEIRIGLGSCCVAGGSGRVFDALTHAVASSGADVSVKRVGCVGMCHQTPLVEMRLPGGEPVLYSSVTPEDARTIVKRHFRPTSMTHRLAGVAEMALERLGGASLNGSITRHPIDYRDPPVASFLGRQRHITTEHCSSCDPTDLDEYLRNDGFVALEQCTAELSPKAIIEEIKQSGLRGRGGAGFPSGLKWSKVQAAPGPVKYVICNGDEGDPGAFMDRMLMESVPYRIIEGLAIAAYAVGARDIYFYIREEYPLAVKRMREALDACEERGLLGDERFGPGAGLRLAIVQGAGAFVCGEETALIASIEGDRGFPRLRPPFPAEQGLWGKPTLVSNVETFATVPWIIRNGAAAFAEMGTAKSKGTKVFALSGKIKRGGLIEVPMGVTIHDIVYDIGGGIKDDRSFKAVQIGGPSGGCVPASLADTPVDYEALAEVGAIMGSGGLVVLDDTDCMVDIARYFLAFTQNQSCGKCTFCRIGTRRMLDILERICAGRGNRADLDLLDRLAEDVTAGSLCGLGKTAPNPVRSTLRYFREEYEAHLEGRCPAGTCKALITYRVTDGCVGCTLCVQHCPDNAIAYTPYERHVIDSDKCTRCDLCRVRCPEDAIEVI